MYCWRQLSQEDRAKLLEARKEQHNPWHSPPHRESNRSESFLFTAACYEHSPYIGLTPERMAAFERSLLEAIEPAVRETIAWVILPNHYHLLLRTPSVKAVLTELAKLHGRTSFAWNGEEHQRGRKIWYRATETVMKSDRHFWATMNYIHHNPVKHRYVQRRQDWPYSSVHAFLASRSRNVALSLWQEYPVGEYGAGWDD